MTRSAPSRLLTAFAAASAGFAAVVAGAPVSASAATAPAAAPLSLSATSTSAAPAVRGAAAWFVDPRTPAERRAEVPVPDRPAQSTGRLRETRAVYRTHDGDLAVPVSTAFGHDLVEGQAVTLDGAGLFVINTTQVTDVARRQMKRLANSLQDAASLRCEGYADYDGGYQHTTELSQARAAKICALLEGDLPGVTTRTVAWGPSHPAVIGGKARQRGLNRRVVIEMTGTRDRSALPAAPQDLRVSVDGTSAGLSFLRVPGTGVNVVTGYQVSTDGGTTWAALATTGGARLSGVVTGLTRGASYSFKVRAVNALGAGPASSVAGAVQAVVPDAPTLLSAFGDNETIFFGYNAPAYDGGSPVLRYEYSTGDGWSTIGAPLVRPHRCRGTAQIPGCADFYQVLTGLVGGHTYDLQVRAVNAVGAGAPSNTLSAPVVSAPSLPTDVATSMTSHTLGLTWSAPANDGGGAASLYYLVRVGAGDYETYTPVDGQPLAKTWEDVTNGVTHAVYVQACNAYGCSDDVRVEQLVAGLPVAPVVDTPVLDGLSAALTFHAPVDTGGLPVIRYEISTDGGTNWATLDHTVDGLDESVLHATLGDLVVGQGVTFWVRAVTEAGDGAASVPLDILPVAVPDAPQDLQATVDGSAVTLSFGVPASDGFSAILGYQVKVDDGDWTDVIATGDPLSAVLTGQTAGLHTYQVRALNLVGSSAAASVADIEIVVTAPSAPVIASGHYDCYSCTPGGSGVLHFNVTGPAADGGSAVTGYEISVDGGGWVALSMGMDFGFGRWLTFEEPAGPSYSIRVRAVNSAGPSDASNAYSIATDFYW